MGGPWGPVVPGNGGDLAGRGRRSIGASGNRGWEGRGRGGGVGGAVPPGSACIVVLAWRGRVWAVFAGWAAGPVEDHLPASIHQGASNLHSDEDMEDKIKLLDPRVQKLIRTYLEVSGELPPSASCDKLVQMDLKLKPEFVGHKMRRRPYPAPKEQADEME